MDDTVEINFDSVEVETDLAWLLDMGDAVIWLPKSGCEIDEQDVYIYETDEEREKRLGEIRQKRDAARIRTKANVVRKKKARIKELKVEIEKLSKELEVSEKKDE